MRSVQRRKGVARDGPTTFRTRVHQYQIATAFVTPLESATSTNQKVTVLRASHMYVTTS